MNLKERLFLEVEAITNICDGNSGYYLAELEKIILLKTDLDIYEIYQDFDFIKIFKHLNSMFFLYDKYNYLKNLVELIRMPFNLSNIESIQHLLDLTLVELGNYFFKSTSIFSFSKLLEEIRLDNNFDFYSFFYDTNYFINEVDYKLKNNCPLGFKNNLLHTLLTQLKSLFEFENKNYLFFQKNKPSFEKENIVKVIQDFFVQVENEKINLKNLKGKVLYVFKDFENKSYKYSIDFNGSSFSVPENKLKLESLNTNTVLPETRFFIQEYDDIDGILVKDKVPSVNIIQELKNIKT